MMFLVPIITGEALGFTLANVYWEPLGLTKPNFSIVWEHLDHGSYALTLRCLGQRTTRFQHAREQRKAGDLEMKMDGSKCELGIMERPKRYHILSNAAA
jgi:hypothetical protein